MYVTNTQTPSESQATSYPYDHSENGLRIIHAQHGREGANATIMVNSPTDVSVFSYRGAVFVEVTTEHGHKVRLEIHGITYNGFMREIFAD